MSFAKYLMAGAVAVGFALPALAGDIEIQDAYARTSGPMAKTGAVFLQIVNAGSGDDRLVGASSDVAMRVELHTHSVSADGVMQMRHVPEGFVIGAGETHALARGGDHVMLMGLTRSLSAGDRFTLTLSFEKAGEIILEVPVDSDRVDGATPAGGNG